MADITETLLTDIKHIRDFEKLDGVGDISTISGLDNLKQAIIRRVMTTPGSMVHRPTYGAGLKTFLGAPATLGTDREIAKRIDEQLIQDVRIAEVLSVLVERTDNTPDINKVIVSVRVVGYDEILPVEVPFGEVF
jgi:phage baseplate assembly protein W